MHFQHVWVGDGKLIYLPGTYLLSGEGEKDW